MWPIISIFLYCVLILCYIEGSHISKRHSILRFRCDNHRYIDSDLICNGQADCPDGSDETKKICQRITCDPGYLKCEYGACVRDLSACLNAHQPDNSTTHKTSCTITNIPRNGLVRLFPNIDVRMNINDVIENFGQIQYACIENHYPIGQSMNLCLNGKWVNEVPDCEPRCNPSVISSITFLPSCYTKTNGRENEVRCADLAQPGTIARINCKWGYERASTTIQVLTCDGDGRWSPLPTQCTQICGEEAAEGTPFIVGGEDVDIKRVPWHVGIYQKNGNNAAFTQQCGGTIIGPKTIISAAHCFWNRIENRLNPETEYRVAAGKYYRELNDPRESNTHQIVGVDKVHLVNGYIDYDGLFANDIAVVIVNNFIEYKVNVAPICIEEYKFDDKIVPPGSIGRVAGWGLVQSAGEPSETLKQIELPVVPREQCLREFDQNFRPFFTSEKFCAGHLTGIGVCRGDSGGGLIFPKTINGRKVYFLRGVVSTGPTNSGSCDNEKYALFTNAAYFWDLIEHHEIANRPTHLGSFKPSDDEPVNECELIKEDRLTLSKCLTDGLDHTCSLTKKIGSTVTTTCAKGYNTRSPIEHKCQPNGKWMPAVSKCNPICGRTPSLPYIPWLVSIYASVGETLPIVGSGTIISERVVLSHGTEESGLFTHDISALQAYTSVLHYYDDDNTDNQQFREVAKRFQHPSPVDESDRTLAVLIMSSRFNFNLNFVAPVCLDSSMSFSFFNNDAPYGETGSVSAYKSVEGHIGEHFYKIIENFECKSNDTNIDRELTRGKMCARRPDSAAGNNCTMMEGAAFVIPKVENGEKVFYLKGIAMKGFRTPQHAGCVDDEFQLFININYFKDSIKAYIMEYD